MVWRRLNLILTTKHALRLSCALVHVYSCGNRNGLTYHQVDVESVASVRGMIPTSKQRRMDLYSVLDRWFGNTFEQHDLFVKGQKGKVE